MSKIMSLIRRSPKRFSFLVAIIAAAIIVPAVAYAWGPDRPVFTGNTPASYPVFNSMTDNPVVGDERNFVRVRESGTGNYINQVNFEPGKVYDVSVYYHNNAASNLNASGKGQAKDATLKMEVPNVVTAGVNAAMTGTIAASNTKPLKVWDEAYGKNATNSDIALRYVSGSARFTSQGAINGQSVPDTLFTTGAKLGYSAQDGVVPGCNDFSGYVTFKLRVDQPGFNVKKEVSTDGKTWSDDTVKATPGSTVQYRLSYQNTGTNQQDNVTLRDMLPAGVTYVNGSSLIANSTTGGQYKTAVDGVAGATGTNVGSYQPKGNVYFKFSAKLPNKDQLKCGTNTLKNVLRVTTNAGYKEDDASVIVNKECEPPVAKYTCDSLVAKKLTDYTVQFTTNYTVENATFKSITYIVRNASGAEIYRTTTPSKTLTYTQTNPGKYSVEALVTVTVNGQDKTTPVGKCKDTFEIVKKVVAKYTCDSLKVNTLTRTTFRFTTAYTAENATFKSVTYTVRNANNQVVDTKTSTSTTLEYTQATPGDYTVQATVTFSFLGDKKVTSEACKAPFTVHKDKVVKYTCNGIAVNSISRTEFRFAVAYSVENATFKGVTYTVRNAAGTVVGTVNSTTNSATYTQTQAGAYSVQATLTFTVDGVDKTVTVPACKDNFTVPNLPKEITVCDLTTKQLVTIKESEFDSSKHSKNLDDCKTPETIKVCEITTKQIVTINKADYDETKYTTDLSKCEDTPVTPPELPTTGAGENIVAIVGLGAMIASIAYYAASRRALNQ